MAEVMLFKKSFGRSVEEKLLLALEGRRQKELLKLTEIIPVREREPKIETCS